MPSTYSNFTDFSRNIRAKIEVDLDQNGTFEDYTANLDHYTIFSSLDNKICGLYESVLEAELYVPNPSFSWAKPGLPVKASLRISNDNFSTEFQDFLFYGTTQRQGTVPNTKLKIKATTSLSNYLDKKVTRQVFVNTDIYTIVDALLTLVGVPALNKSISTYGVAINYVVDSSRPVRVFVEELLQGSLSIAGFDRDNVFRIRQSLPLDFLGSGFASISTYTKRVIKTDGYKSQDISSKYYANRLKIKGQSVTLKTSTSLYFNSGLSGNEIKPNSKLYYTLELKDYDVISFSNFVSGGPAFIKGILSAGSPKSYFAFFTADDGAGLLDISNVVIDSVSLINEAGIDKLFFVFQNNSGANSYFLKYLNVIGAGLFKSAELMTERENTANSDGQEILQVLESRAIQSQVQADNLASRMQLNLFFYADVYKIEARGQPKSEIGQIVTIQDRNANNIQGVLLESDTVVSQDEGYTQALTVKKLRTDLSFFSWDVASKGWDQGVWF